MSILTLLFLFMIMTAVFFVVRSIIHVYKRTSRSPIAAAQFPLLSICLLCVSLVLLIAGTIISLMFNDALGGAIASFGGFFGLLESNIRHKREALTITTKKDN